MSFFKSVTKYRVSETQNPRENRLTEVTAAVLKRVDAFAIGFLSVLLDGAAADFEQRSRLPGDADQGALLAGAARMRNIRGALQAIREPQVHIRTQRTTSSVRYVDLEVHVQSGAGEPGLSLLFWVEVKHGAGLHGDQLSQYVKDINDEPADQRCVLVLAPRQSKAKLGDAPDTVPVVEWQTAAGEARRHLTRRRRELTEVETFLLTDYCDYLKEEELMDAEFLTAEQVFVLSAHPQAAHTMNELVRLIDGLVRKEWGDPEDHAGSRTSPDYGTGYWTNYPTGISGAGPAAWGETKFEWGLFIDDYRLEPRDGWVFAAGASFRPDHPAVKSANGPWLAALEDEGFEHVDYDGSWRLWRHRYPEELLSASSLVEQAQLLAGWVIEAFDHLAARPPSV